MGMLEGLTVVFRISSGISVKVMDGSESESEVLWYCTLGQDTWTKGKQNIKDHERMSTRHIIGTMSVEITVVEKTVREKGNICRVNYPRKKAILY